MSDDDLIAHLVQVRGIGKWTVEMFLMFYLGRPDLLPVDDYGIRKGFALTFLGLKPTAKVTPADLPKADIMLRRARRWQPFRSRRELVSLASRGPRRGQAPLTQSPAEAYRLTQTHG